MNISQWVIFSVLLMIAFSKDKASSIDAFILIIAYLFYQSFIVGVDFILYYSYAAVLNLIVGMILDDKNKKAAICSYSLALCNVFGFVMWHNYYPPDIYDNISLLILILQIITILPKGILNGIGRSIQYFIAKSSIFNSIKAHITMYKSRPIKETKQ